MGEKKIKKTIYFVRHGQSEDNIAPVFQSPRSPLTEKGRLQAERIAARVSKIPFEALIASPFERTQQTAVAIARATGKAAEYCDLFTERIPPTNISGKPYDDPQADALWREWEKSLYTPNMRVEEGENFDDLVARADKALAFLTARPESSLVVVTHGYFLRTMMARVLLGGLLSGESHRRLQSAASSENTGITVFRHESKPEKEPSWRLWVYNDHAHLG